MAPESVRRLARRGLLALLVLTAWRCPLPPGALAAEQPEPAEKVKRECADAYLAAQRLRKEAELLAARQNLLRCARDQCPPVVKPDCVQWLAEVEEAIPTIVFAAKGLDGRDTTAVRVSLDGELLADRIDGKPVALDPGVHQVRFELTEAAAEPAAQEERIVVRQGEKNRLVATSFARRPEPSGGGDAGADQAPAVEERSAPVAAIVIGSVGVAGMAVFAALGAVGTSELDDLRATCGKTSTCDPADVNAARGKLIGADVALGVGIAGIAVGTGLLLYHYLSEPNDETAWSWGVGPTDGGAYGRAKWSW